MIDDTARSLLTCYYARFEKTQIVARLKEGLSVANPAGEELQVNPSDNYALGRLSQSRQPKGS
jgi:hypothetical protein